jgi:uncharacterized membrane protein YGL010W
MKTLTQHLSQYAAYHRDRRNIATHFVGIPLIVLGVAGLLSRPAMLLGGVPLSAALLVTLGSIIFYLALDLRYGIAMTGFMGLAVWAGAHLAAQSTYTWLGLSLGAFVIGWVIQFIGHAFEGKKPAFVDDLVGLLVGPLFIVAEAGFAIGLRNDLREAIEAEVGPTLIRPRRGSAPSRA